MENQNTNPTNLEEIKTNDSFETETAVEVTENETVEVEEIVAEEKSADAVALESSLKRLHPLVDFEINNFGWKLSQIRKMINNGKLSLEYPLQREKGVWSLENKQLLIDSIIVGIPIVPVFVVSKALDDEKLEELENIAQEKIQALEAQRNEENDETITKKQQEIQNDFDKLESEHRKKEEKGEAVEIRYIIDGLQRISTLYDFMEDKFPMPDDAPIYVSDDEEIDIAGKYFSELSAELQATLSTWNLRVFSLNSTNVPNDIVEMLFIRLNNGVPLKADQKLKSVFGLDVAPKLLEFAELPFIKHTALSKGAIQSDSHLSALIMYMMFEESVNKNVKHEDYSIKAIMKYAKKMRETMSQEEIIAKFDELKSELNHADDLIGNTKTKFLKRAIIPLVLTVFKNAKKDDIPSDITAEWFEKFVEEIEADVEYEHDYNLYRNKGTTKPHIMMHKYVTMYESLSEYAVKIRN